jgi:ornithine cyclodeaminase/alanine dehydrogenase-like protein (mu-crystallin family)
MHTKLIARSDMETILSRVGLDALMDQLIDRLREGFSTADLAHAQIPARSGLHYHSPDLGLIEWMPANLKQGKASLKIVGYHPTNPSKRSLPTILSTLSVYDTRSGHLLGLLDGTLPTALRTGAMSAIATELLGPPRDGLVLGIVGCGAQAVTQCHALSRLLPIARIVAHDRNPQAAESLSQRTSFLSIPIEPVAHGQLTELLEASDLLCTCTSEDPGRGPLFPDFANRPGLHINAVGCDFPEKFELPVELLRRSYVCPDFREQALIEGECQQLQPAEIGDDLATLLRDPEAARAQRERLTVFDSTGHAYADYLSALLFLDYAGEMELGTDIGLECIPADPLDPYSFLNPSARKDSASACIQESGT